MKIIGWTYGWGVKRKLILVTGIIAAIIIIISLTGRQVILASTTSRLLPIYGVDLEAKKVAISFDACWGAEYTPGLLKILADNNVKTTFFLVNIWLEKYPEAARTIANAGHELGLHSATHPHFSQLSREAMRQELIQNLTMIKEVTGYQPTLFRPPYGEYNNTLIQVTKEMELKTIQWSIDSLDWKEVTTDQIVERVMTRIHPGAIILFHNNGENTPAAIARLLPILAAAGYEIVPISRLLLDGDYYIDHQGIQKKR